VDCELVGVVFSGSNQSLSTDPTGGDPSLPGSVDGVLDGFIAVAIVGQQVNLSYPLSRREKIFYNSGGGGNVQLTLQLADSSVEPG
jgi:hypothetical protein